MLEEVGLPYTVHPIDISKNEQFAPDFLKVASNNRIPAIVDRDNNMSLMESGAILIYLAEKTGKLLPKSGEERYRAIEWLMWQMGGRPSATSAIRSPDSVPRPTSAAACRFFRRDRSRSRPIPSATCCCRGRRSPECGCSTRL